MRFRHRVIPPDQPPMDEAGEVMLPDDLAVLGERLRRDADLLSAQYPARSPEDDMKMQGARSDGKPAAARAYWYATAAVAVLMLAVAGWPAMNRLMRQSSDAHALVTESSSEPTLLKETDDGVSPTATTDSIGVTDLDMQPANYHGERSIETTPAVFLQDVSGPELEGLLDLWEQEQSTTSSVSI